MAVSGVFGTGGERIQQKQEDVTRKIPGDSDKGAFVGHKEGFAFCYCLETAILIKIGIMSPEASMTTMEASPAKPGSAAIIQGGFAREFAVAARDRLLALGMPGFWPAKMPLFAVLLPLSAAYKGLSVVLKPLATAHKGLSVAFKPLGLAHKGLSVAFKPLEMAHKGLGVIFKPSKFAHKGLAEAFKPLFLKDKGFFAALKSRFPQETTSSSLFTQGNRGRGMMAETPAFHSFAAILMRSKLTPACSRFRRVYQPEALNFLLFPPVLQPKTKTKSWLRSPSHGMAAIARATNCAGVAA